MKNTETRACNIAVRLTAPAKAGPLELQLTLEEAASIVDAAEESGLKPGTYCRRVVEGVFGAESALENVKLHAGEMNLPVSVLCKILVLAAANHPEDETLKEYKKIARRVGREIWEGAK